MSDTPIGLGLMSGTSLDGLDMALCEFRQQDAQWRYRALHCRTIPLNEEWRDKLSRAELLSALEFMKLDRAFARWMGVQANHLIREVGIRPDFIASHGQTIFHQPHLGLTVQIGSGAEIAAETGITTICDFRTTDVALGGQGAPLVPIGDQLLFSQYDACLNLGGFSNISLDENGQRTAFDISPCNMLLNTLAQKAGKMFDQGGCMAREGFIFRPLLDELNALGYYQQPGNKSLGKEWFVSEVLPRFEKSDLCVEDQLRCATEHIATQISNTLNIKKIHSVLATGGGTKNTYLMDRIRALSPNAMVIVPDEATVDFKEAIIFAFLGLLRLRGAANCLSSATGARRDCCGGAIYEGILPG